MSKNHIAFNNEREKEIVNILKSMNSKHNIWTLFNDFLTMSACAISNSVDLVNREWRENLYMQTIKKYTGEELNRISDMFALLVLAFEEHGMYDALGELFCKLELHSERHGQFFTPMHVCECMAELQVGTLTEKEVRRRGYLTVRDPAVGGGALLIAFAKVLRKRDINYQEYMLAIGTDIDIRAVYMSYIQLSLLGIPAIVYRGNTLSDNPYGESVQDRWIIPMYFIKGFQFKEYNPNPIRFEFLKDRIRPDRVGTV